MDRRSLIIALIVSAALNLFLISAGASAWLLNRHAPVAAANPGLRRAASSLPQPERRAFVKVLRSEGALVRPENRRARSIRDQAWSQLADASATADQIKAELAAARQINQTSRSMVENAVVDFGETLAPAERRMLGEALRPGPPGSPRP